MFNLAKFRTPVTREEESPSGATDAFVRAAMEERAERRETGKTSRSPTIRRTRDRKRISKRTRDERALGKSDGRARRPIEHARAIAISERYREMLARANTRAPVNVYLEIRVTLARM